MTSSAFGSQIIVEESRYKAEGPISNLSNDILWAIFSLNAHQSDERDDEHDFEPPPLLTLLRTSQVCSRWRNLILSTSSLWGQTINLDLLQKQEWREEVMRRTGDAVLCIKGFCSADEGVDESVALLILDENWSRMQSVDISFITVKDWGSFKDLLFRIICRPAYRLEEFLLEIPSWTHVENSNTMQRADLHLPSDFLLFDNKAPVLFTLDAPQIKMDLRAPWLSQLQVLVLNGPIPLNDVLQALAHMPLLKRLELDGDPYAIAHEHGLELSLQEVRLPLLERISLVIEEPIKPHITFLTHIQTPPQCCFSLDVSVDFPNPDEVAHAKEVLALYLSLCSSGKIEDVHVQLSITSLCLKFKNSFPNESHSDFSLTVNDIPAELIPYVNSIPSIVPLPICHKTKRLSLHGVERIPYFELAAFDLISWFPTLEVLELVPKALKHILRLPRDVLSSVFTKLHTLKLYCFPKEEEMGFIEAFLALRILAGRPLRRIVVSTVVCPYIKVDRELMRNLPVFNGLEIVIKIHDCNGCA